MEKTIILIVHKKRQGKDTLAGMMAEITGGTILRFADPLKEILATTFNISVAELEDLKNEEVNLTHGHYHWHKEMLTVQTYRDVLQRFGTEAMKKAFGDNVWGELMVKRIKESDAKVIIIPDFRFKGEYETIAKQFKNVGTINIVRDETFTDTHASETELDDFVYNVLLYNCGTIEELRSMAERICEMI